MIDLLGIFAGGPIEYTVAERFAYTWLLLVTPIAVVLLVVGLIKGRRKLAVVSLCLLVISVIAFFMP